MWDKSCLGHGSDQTTIHHPLTPLQDSYFTQVIADQSQRIEVVGQIMASSPVLTQDRANIKSNSCDSLVGGMGQIRQLFITLWHPYTTHTTQKKSLLINLRELRLWARSWPHRLFSHKTGLTSKVILVIVLLGAWVRSDNYPSPSDTPTRLTLHTRSHCWSLSENWGCGRDHGLIACSQGLKWIVFPVWVLLGTWVRSDNHPSPSDTLTRLRLLLWIYTSQ